LSTIRELVTSRHVLCVVGPGGVGKTTTAAALGVCAAQAGRRVLVITIDPARRLASAMGLAELAQVAREVRVPDPGTAAVSLHVMMLDLKAAWDDMVRRLNPDIDQRERILRNRFYRSLSTMLAGAQEYVAAEQLYTLCTERDYELIVLDTPPSVHAIDFLEAPGRVLDLLESDAVGFFLGPAGAAGRSAARLFDLSGRYVMRTLEKLAGGEMLTALYEFLAAFHSMYPAFRERSLGFREIFGSRETAFVVVATPARQALREVGALSARLASDGLNLGAVVINQVRPAVAASALEPVLEATLADSVAAPERTRMATAIQTAVAQRAHRAAAETRAVEETMAALPPHPRVMVPRLPHDVHDMNSLVEVARELCAPTADPA